MNAIRKSIADALGIPVSDLGCFTLCDHDGQPAILSIHGGEYQGVWVECDGGKKFIQLAKL